MAKEIQKNSTASPPKPKNQAPPPEAIKEVYEKLYEPKGFGEILAELRRNVDPKLVKEREGWRDRNGNVQMVDYVEWHTVADILDDVAPNWNHHIVDIKEIGDVMTVIVEIEIEGVRRQGIGTGNAHNEMGIKKAEHDALKRAAVKFGIARDLYRKESDVIERGGNTNHYDQGNGQGFPSNPISRNLGEMLTEKQLGMIRALSREARIDADQECQSVMQCNAQDLTKQAASAFIKYLQGGRKTIDRPSDQLVNQERPQPAPRPQQNASGETVNTKTRNTIRMTLHNMHADEATWVNTYSNGRTQKLEDLTQDEADSLLQDAEGYDPV